MSSWKTKVAAIATVVSLSLFIGCTDTSGDNKPDDTENNGGYITNPHLTDDAINANDTLSLDASVEYTLDGFVFIEDGAVLTIPAGTVIKGKSGQGENASALIVARGAKLYVDGTASEPVIMTSETDDGDLDATARGLWGGLILLGKAPINKAAGTGQIEGIPATDSRGIYGGTESGDNSGSITYLSVRYGGSNIGEDNEINGVTFGGVGSGTVIENIEVFNNKDDGYEWFGGTVTTKNLLSYGCGDDSFDWDEGFRGTGENWIAIQTDDAGDKLAEMDGSASDNYGNAAYSKPTIKNATLIGNADKSGLKFREETGVNWTNSIFVNVDEVKIDDAKGTTMIGVGLFVAGDWSMSGNVFESVDETVVVGSDEVTNITDIQAKISKDNTMSASTGVTASNLTPTDNTKGAVVGGDWTAGWTKYSSIK